MLVSASLDRVGLLILLLLILDKTKAKLDVQHHTVKLWYDRRLQDLAVPATNGTKDKSEAANANGADLSMAEEENAAVEVAAA